MKEHGYSSCDTHMLPASVCLPPSSVSQCRISHQRGIVVSISHKKRTGLPCPASLDLIVFHFFFLFVCVGSLAPIWQDPALNPDQILPVHTCVWTSSALPSLDPPVYKCQFPNLPTCCWCRRRRPALLWPSSRHQGPIFTRRQNSSPMSCPQPIF